MSASNLIFLDYTFLFDTTDTFQYLYQFEKELGDFLKTKGFEAHVIDTVQGAPSRRILFITKAPSPDVQSAATATEATQTVKERIRQVRKPRFRKTG